MSDQTTERAGFRRRAWRAFWRGFLDGLGAPATFLLGCRDGLRGLIRGRR